MRRPAAVSVSISVVLLLGAHSQQTRSSPPSFMLDSDFSTGFPSDGTAGGQQPELHLQRRVNYALPAGGAAGRQARQL